MDNVALFLIKDVNFNKQHSVIPRDCSSLTKVSTRIYKQYVKGLYFTIIVLLNKYKQLIAQLHCSMPCMADEIIFDIHNGWNDAISSNSFVRVSNFGYNADWPQFFFSSSHGDTGFCFVKPCKPCVCRVSSRFCSGLLCVLMGSKSL